MASSSGGNGWLRKSTKALLSFTWPVLLTVSLAMIFMTAVAQIFGDLERFQEWQRTHYAYMLTWRLFLYAAIGFAWLKLRSGLKERATDISPYPSGLRRCEIMAVCIVSLFELRRAALAMGVDLP